MRAARFNGVQVCLVAVFSSFGDEWTRTSALANVGALLARQGHRVACTSTAAQAYLLDLLLAGGNEAETLALRRRPGLFDLLLEYRDALLAAPFDESVAAEAATPAEIVAIGSLRLRRPSSVLVRAPIARAGGEPLFVLRGGPRRLDGTDTSSERVDWAELAGRWGGAAYLEWLKHDLADHVDVLLVDCDVRSDEVVGMFAGSIADVLVMLSNYSNQETAPAYHLLAKLTGIDGYEEPPRRPSILPVPAGIEMAELELRSRGREAFMGTFAKFLPAGSDAELLRRYELPETPVHYRLGTQLVAWADPKRSAELQPYAELADAIVGMPCSPALSLETLRQRFADVPGRRNWDVFVSYSSDDRDLALELRRRLLDAGLRPFVAGRDLAAQVGSSEWLAAVGRVLDCSRALVALVSPSARASEWVAWECDEFHRRGRGLLIPVCLPPVTPRDLDAPLSRYHALVASDSTADDVIELVHGARQ